MKSAYELAMERLAKADPSAGKALTSEQKKKLEAIDTTYQSKIAERMIFLDEKLNHALREGDAEEVEKIQKQKQSEKSRLEDDRESEKDKLRKSF
jgi:actin-related protein